MHPALLEESSHAKHSWGYEDLSESGTHRYEKRSDGLVALVQTKLGSVHNVLKIHDIVLGLFINRYEFGINI
jgi:hypothetical protein